MDEGLVDLDEAVRRIPPSSLVRIRDPRLDPDAERTLLGSGLPASPGAAVGKAVFSAARAEELAEAGHDVVLLRPFTSPDDIAGFIAARGIVTAHGGRTSHAAVVARGMDRPAVCGVAGLEVGADRATFPGGSVAEGEDVSVDGTSGEVYAGAIATVPPAEDARIHTLLGRCDAGRRIPVLVDGDQDVARPAWADAVLPAGGTARVASAEELEEALDDLAVERVVLDLGACRRPGRPPQARRRLRGPRARPDGARRRPVADERTVAAPAAVGRRGRRAPGRLDSPTARRRPREGR